MGASLTSQIKEALAKEFGEADAETFFSILGENGFDDDESILDDVKDGDDSLLKEDDNMTDDAFECIQRVCAQHGKEFEDLPDPTKMKDWDAKFEEAQALYLKQCESIFMAGRDASLKNMATMGRFYGNVPLVSYCADTFNRFRIEEFLRSNGAKQLSASEFVSSVPFYHGYNEQTNSIAIKEKKIDLLTTLESYSQRFADPLQLTPNAVFVDDNLDDILCYIFAVSQMIGSLLEQDTADNDNLGLDVPFQFDLAILPYGGKQKVEKPLATVGVPAEADDDDDDDEDEEDDEEKNDALLPSVEPILPGLQKLGLKHVKFAIAQQTLPGSATGDIAALKRQFKNQFKQVVPKRHGRYVMVVDRRGGGQGKSGGGGDDDEKTSDADQGSKKHDDEIWMYSPECEKEAYHQLHEDYVEESLLYKTIKCLIPSTRAIMHPHFGCKHRDVITLSFHVLRKDLVKCYLYINDSGARFEATDLINILPRFFAKSSNAAATALTPAQMQQKFGLKLQDNQFEAWYKKTTSTSKN